MDIKADVAFLKGYVWIYGALHLGCLGTEVGACMYVCLYPFLSIYVVILKHH